MNSLIIPLSYFRDRNRARLRRSCLQCAAGWVIFALLTVTGKAIFPNLALAVAGLGVASLLWMALSFWSFEHVEKELRLFAEKRGERALAVDDHGLSFAFFLLAQPFRDQLLEGGNCEVVVPWERVVRILDSSAWTNDGISIHLAGTKETIELDTHAFRERKAEIVELARRRIPESLAS